MTWLEGIGAHLPPILYNSLLTLLIVSLTVGTVWGIRPALQALLNRFSPRWRDLGATLLQLLLVVSGMALIVVMVGRNALLITIGLAVAFFSGMIVGGETLLADGIATMRIRGRRRYRVGDVVTLGDHYHGVVQTIGNIQTALVSPEQATITVRNSFILRHPIVVHPQTTVAAREDALPPQSPGPSAPDHTPHQGAPSAALAVDMAQPAPTVTTVVTAPTVPTSPIVGLEHSTALDRPPTDADVVSDVDTVDDPVDNDDPVDTDDSVDNIVGNVVGDVVGDVVTDAQGGGDEVLATDHSAASETPAQPTASPKPHHLIRTPHAIPLARRAALGKRTVNDLR